MNKFLVSLLIVCGAHGVLGLLDDGIRVKWGVPLLNSDYFINIPRLLDDTVANGWEEKLQPADAALPSLSIYCPKDDVTFCTLFDDTGIIAGLQVALKDSATADRPIEPATIAFIPWTVDGEIYWVHQQLFISEDTLNLSAEERKTQRESSTDILQEGALWLRDLDGSLLKISANGTEMDSSVFTKQACIISMGLHYYYNMSSEIDCSSLYPWFTLVNDDNLVATGFMFFRNYTSPASGTRMWFEQPSQAAVKMIVPRAPQCLYDLSSSPGITTMHIFYGKHPYKIFC